MEEIKLEAAVTLPQDISFESERLKMTPTWNADSEELALAANYLEIAVAVGEKFPYPYTPESAQSYMDDSKKVWMSEGQFNFMIRSKEDDKFIGAIGFKVKDGKVPNIGYWLAKESWGKGYATESLIRTIKFIKQQFPEITEVMAGAYKYNKASQKVLEKCGFKNIGEKLEEGVLRNGELKDGFVYKLEI